MKLHCAHKQHIWPLVIIGAGPMGIESALYAQRLGIKTLVLEASSQIAATLAQLGELKLYPSASQVITPLGQALLADKVKIKNFSAQSYREQYLLPLVERAGIEIAFEHKIESIGRRGVLKTTLETNQRKNAPFKMVATTAGGSKTLLAEKVIDATGSYSTPLALGEGRLPALGEPQVAERIVYGLADFNKDFARYNGRTTLLFGDGYAAFCSFRRFVELKHKWHPDTRLICIKDGATEPFYQGFVNDGFNERAQIYHSLQADKDLSNLVSFRTQASVLEVRYRNDQHQAWWLELCTPNEMLELEADHVISNYGFQADNRLWQGLQVHQCYASGAPMNYAAAMLDEVRGGQAITQAMPKTAMQLPEPNFYVLGAKSYGNTPGFYSRIGLGQIVSVFQLISDDPKLNLYGEFVADLIRSDQMVVDNQPQKLSDSEQRYKTITEHLKEVVFQTDLNQRITYLSDSWHDLSGFDPQDFIGLIWQDLLHDDSAGAGLAQCNAFMSRNLGDYKEEFQVKCMDGGLKWVEVNASLLRDKNGAAYGTIGSMLDITDRIEVNRELNKLKEGYQLLAYRDELTGIANRLKLNEELAKSFALYQRYDTPFSIILFDVDLFKKFNDRFGHLLGDEVLQKLTQRVKQSLRATDQFGRWGGEEFLVIAANTALGEAKILAEKIRTLVADQPVIEQAKVTISLGVAEVQASENLEQLLNRADTLLYQAKDSGRNLVRF